jgi:hypothetical protein
MIVAFLGDPIIVAMVTVAAGSAIVHAASEIRVKLARVRIPRRR